jgi:hypothetical protein
MSPRDVLTVVALACCVPGGSSYAQEETPRGVNPKDNLNKAEFIYKAERFDGGRHLDALAAKYDRAITPQFGVNVEVPLLRIATPGFSELGLGDVQLRLRYNVQLGAVTLIPGAEIVAPTASKDALGAGMWQINPVLGAVVSPTPTTFVFAGYKHLRSLGGDAGRPDINASQPRLIVGRLSAAGWWALVDVRHTRDHVARTDALDAEAEFGQMLSARMGVSARLGTSALDSSRNATASLNLRILF